MILYVRWAAGACKKQYPHKIPRYRHKWKAPPPDWQSRRRPWGIVSPILRHSALHGPRLKTFSYIFSCVDRRRRCRHGRRASSKFNRCCLAEIRTAPPRTGRRFSFPSIVGFPRCAFGEGPPPQHFTSPCALTTIVDQWERTMDRTLAHQNSCHARHWQNAVRTTTYNISLQRASPSPRPPTVPLPPTSAVSERSHEGTASLGSCEGGGPEVIGSRRPPFLQWSLPPLHKQRARGRSAAQSRPTGWGVSDSIDNELLQLFQHHNHKSNTTLSGNVSSVWLLISIRNAACIYVQSGIIYRKVRSAHPVAAQNMLYNVLNDLLRVRSNGRHLHSRFGF